MTALCNHVMSSLQAVTPRLSLGMDTQYIDAAQQITAVSLGGKYVYRAPDDSQHTLASLYTQVRRLHRLRGH